MFDNVIYLSRLQFAITAIYHWIYVPLTLGLGFIIAIMESKYVMTGDEFWKRTTKFWMKLFAINFAVGVATGLILEFEFGTNWSNYSWFVGDIFGAPLAIEGIFAFFLESTFFAIMYFGWEKVGKKTHLASTWLTAIGSNLSALWILIANSWMQYPVGMKFNPETARSEMVDFWSLVFSPVAVNKFIHSVTNGFVLSSIVVIGISSWFLLKKRETELSRKSIRIASVFGIISLAVLIFTGDGSAYSVGKVQPMKLAAMEGLYDGQKNAPLVAVGVLNPDKEVKYNMIIEPDSEKGKIITEENDEKVFLFKISIPNFLSFLATRSTEGFVPGINDIIKGGYEFTDIEGNIAAEPSFSEKKLRGTQAVNSLREYKMASDAGDSVAMNEARTNLEDNFKYFGYNYIENPEDIIPNVPLVFYSFHIMVALGMLFILVFIIFIILEWRNLIEQKRHKWALWLGIISIPLVYICSDAGWIVAEAGRQPWTIQNLLPVNAAVSGINAGHVLTTLIILLVLFAVLLCVALSIIFKQIKKGA